MCFLARLPIGCAPPKIHFCRYLKLPAGDSKLAMVRDGTKEEEIMTGIDFFTEKIPPVLHYRYVVFLPLADFIFSVVNLE